MASMATLVGGVSSMAIPSTHQHCPGLSSQQPQDPGVSSLRPQGPGVSSIQPQDPGVYSMQPQAAGIYSMQTYDHTQPYDNTQKYHHHEHDGHDGEWEGECSFTFKGIPESVPSNSQDMRFRGADVPDPWRREHATGSFAATPLRCGESVAAV